MWRRGSALAAGALGVSLALAACGGGSSGGDAAASANNDPACSAYQDYMGHSGTTVTMFASIISPESDSLEKSWAEFSRCTGIKISYEGGNNFESQLPVRVAGGNAPDFAIIPQPGLLQKMVKSGKVAKPPQAVVDNVEKYWNKAWKAYGTVNGTFYAAPMSANMKSMVWYSPKAFAAAGYKAPTTWQELVDLSDKITASGKGKAWCGGIGSGTATGWPATDWLEEIVLGNQGGDVYDKWVNHEIKFNSPEITKAMDTLASWMKNPKWVNGGFGDVKTIATTTFQDAGKPILTGKCWMLQQASFYGAQWKEGTKVGPDGNVFAFYLPGSNPAIQTPVEGGGEFVTAFSDRPEVQAVQSYLSTPEWHSSRVKVAEGWVSANSGVDKALYTNPVDQLSAKYLTDPNATFRFDASDLMPAAVGAGSEWKEMTAWFASDKPTADVLTAIDASWPTS
jgi:alpha-glucoside transport system substrate-binding protein